MKETRYHLYRVMAVCVDRWEPYKSNGIFDYDVKSYNPYAKTVHNEFYGTTPLDLKEQCENQRPLYTADALISKLEKYNSLNVLNVDSARMDFTCLEINADSIFDKILSRYTFRHVDCRDNIDTIYNSPCNGLNKDHHMIGVCVDFTDNYVYVCERKKDNTNALIFAGNAADFNKALDDEKAKYRSLLNEQQKRIDKYNELHTLKRDKMVQERWFIDGAPYLIAKNDNVDYRSWLRECTMNTQPTKTEVESALNGGMV